MRCGDLRPAAGARRHAKLRAQRRLRPRVAEAAPTPFYHHIYNVGGMRLSRERSFTNPNPDSESQRQPGFNIKQYRNTHARAAGGTGLGLYENARRDSAKLTAARGRPIIVEWERRKAFGGPLSFGDSSLRYRALHLFISDSQSQPNLRRCHVKNKPGVVTDILNRGALVAGGAAAHARTRADMNVGARFTIKKKKKRSVATELCIHFDLSIDICPFYSTVQAKESVKR
ncbi:hypothetical protein EVAR_44778_1 [Eumeta japonica]|uniref:Uncharacterized protein n=1 Tax=Eumeta variegata TaxID=151549 RepID=A0A4C1Y5A7_EUMVA|nr:hypothetical protein EVAR_44778_1 [Eumeta japonica]